MKNKKKIYGVIVKIVLTLVGLLSLIHIVKNYGIQLVWQEVNRSGAMLLLLALTFVPTLLCYSFAWLLATRHQRMKDGLPILRKSILFFKYTIISVSWNNLTPFLKIGGEPLKYMMLLRHMSRRDAVASTINYNVIHLLATGISFIVCALLLIFFYSLPEVTFYWAIAFVVLFPLMIYVGYRIFHSTLIYSFRKLQFRFVKVFVINYKIGMRRLLFFYQENPKAFFLSLLIDLAARFIEGVTFYFGFLLIQHPVSLFSSAILDVGRTFVDTVFFFIPYQIGSREEGVRFFMEKILVIDSKGFLTVVLFYRFVEVFWIAIGYILWVNDKSPSNEVRV